MLSVCSPQAESPPLDGMLSKEFRVLARAADRFSLPAHPLPRPISTTSPAAISAGRAYSGCDDSDAAQGDVRPLLRTVHRALFYTSILPRSQPLSQPARDPPARAPRESRHPIAQTAQSHLQTLHTSSAIHASCDTAAPLCDSTSSEAASYSRRTADCKFLAWNKEMPLQFDISGNHAQSRPVRSSIYRVVRRRLIPTDTARPLRRRVPAVPNQEPSAMGRHSSGLPRPEPLHAPF